MDEASDFVSQAQAHQLRVRQDEHNTQLNASLFATLEHIRSREQAGVYACAQRGCVHGGDCLSERGYHETQDRAQSVR